MKFLSKDEINALDTQAAKRQLKLLESTYDLDCPVSKLDHKIWMIADDIANQLLWLEERIHKLSFDEETV